MAPPLPASVEATAALLAGQGYVADRELATVVHLSLAMRRPLLLEGEPGTGKTEIARCLATGLGRRLVRLQCYDGLDLAAAEGIRGERIDHEKKPDLLAVGL